MNWRDKYGLNDMKTTLKIIAKERKSLLENKLNIQSSFLDSFRNFLEQDQTSCPTFNCLQLHNYYKDRSERYSIIAYYLVFGHKPEAPTTKPRNDKDKEKLIARKADFNDEIFMNWRAKYGYNSIQTICNKIREEKRSLLEDKVNM